MIVLSSDYCTKKASFAPWIKNNFGKKGEKWLSDLPEIIDILSARYKLFDIKPIDNSVYNFTALGEQYDGEPVFLKIGFHLSEIKREVAAIKALKNDNMINLIASDQEYNAILLPNLFPADNLHSLNNENRQNYIAADLISKMPCEVISDFSFPLLTDWFDTIKNFLNKPDHRIPVKYLKNTVSLFSELEKDKISDKLLHGDLHHYNILKSESKWLVIDPKGVIGNPIYETAAFMYNPSPHFLKYKNLKTVINNRFNTFSEISGYHYRNIAAMAYCQSVLSACWCVMDQQNCYKNALTAADLFYDFI